MVIFYLLVFVIATTIGYVAYIEYLTAFSPEVLVLNTFVFLLILRLVNFQNGIGFRNPLKSFRYVIDGQSLKYAIFNFGYWLLFWRGIAYLAEADSSAVSISILAITTLSAPLAAKLAKAEKIGVRYIFFAIFVLFLVATSATLLRTDPTMQDFISALQFLSSDREWQFPFELNSSLIAGVVCLLAAIFCEAVADYATVRQDFQSRSSAGDRLNRILEVGELAQRADAMLRTAELPKLLDDLDNLYKSECTELEVRLADIDSELKELEDQQSGRGEASLTSAEFGELYSNLLKVSLQSQAEVEEFANKRSQLEGWRQRHPEHSKRQSAACRADLIKSHWSCAYDLCEVQFDKVGFGDKRQSVEVRYDLMAVVGFVLSFVFVVANSNSTLVPDFEDGVTILIALSVLGLAGSAARAFAIIPINGMEGPYDELVPPCYAIRPIVLALALSFWSGGIATFLQDKNAGWYIGASLLVIVTGFSLDNAVRKILAYKENKSSTV